MGRALGAAACAREAGGGVPARVRGRGRGCAKYAGGQGAGRASDPGSPESDGRTAGGHTRENPGGPALRPRVEKLLVVPAGRSSRSPALSVRDQYSLPPKPASAGCVPHALVTAVTLKKKSFDLSFSDSSENPAPGTFSPVLFIQVVALLVLSEDVSSPSF